MEGSDSTEGMGARTLAARALGGKKTATGNNKYGNLNPKAKLIQKDVKYFDSADWALQKEGSAQAEPAEGEEALPPKLLPSGSREKRPSQLSYGKEDE
mmetsp:Transcript_36357/g.50512  ORF Transcript_36357/g.50512 Transcript_36357/m.50512 type:complete len:98 (-) Transcript_36357:174-467(-)|eukprot:CAMPEP_0196579550 /NCGR_PEP_ID=MMETSP1081-20130531/22683_1 /TAXON_ID=36882 /ORGANISM="Pyramimonas amylifera, Strain CCMP720" /LENGTH=97 /DNA_ID=CAMNT_0041899173 /DNA_START=385 /DNA_END=678 /DNA_ORIENTATION=+